jgi:hypothetical protein
MAWYILPELMETNKLLYELDGDVMTRIAT